MKINSVVLFLITGILMISSCNKTDVEELPDKFTKKVLVEEFSGEWCSSCVRGAEELELVLSEDRNKYFGVSIHNGDPFEIEFPKISDFLLSEFNIDYFPYAIFDRTSNENIGWIAEANSRQKIDYNLGLKISTTVKNNSLDITVSCASTKNYSDIFLSVYLVEDNVPESSEGAQVGGGGNYIHHHILRQVLTNKIGDPIKIAANEVLEKTYNSISIGNYKKEDLKVIAFVHFSSSKSFEIMNTNGVLAGGNIGWD